jgi:hypothetical protein
MPAAPNRWTKLAGLGQRVGQDPDHGFFNLPGSEPPALRAIRSGIGDQCSGDVVAIASALRDGVSRSSLSVDQQARQQARLGCCGPMAARVGSELVSNSSPGLIVDQRRLLAGVVLTLLRNLAGINRVREQCVEMTAREGFAAALGAIRRCAAFRPKSKAVGLLLRR